MPALAALAVALLLCLAPSTSAMPADAIGGNAPGFALQFFPFKNSLETAGPPSVEDQARLVRELGFDGFDNRDLTEIEQAARALEQQGLKLFTSYFTVNIDPGEEPYNPRLPEALKALANHGTILWCNTHSKRFKPSDPAGDDYAVPIFRRIADLAAPFGVKVAPYPHINFWVESPQDTARLADKVDRPNFGTSFNLFHWKAIGDRALSLEETVSLCAPRMLVMSLNGSHGPAKIGPLEDAELDEYYRVLEAFCAAGFKGPVGLQCYMIDTDPKVHLAQSMRVWLKLKAQLLAALPSLAF